MGEQRSTVVLVHGAWHGCWCWDSVVPRLEERGLDVRTVALPSIDADPASGADLSGDAATVAAVLDGVDTPALLCGHSYGGVVVTRAAAGRTDIARLVYLAAFMPDAGESLFSITGGPAPWIVQQIDGRVLPDPGLACDTFYGDCSPAVQQLSLERLRPMPTAPFSEPVPEAAWRTIPSTYVVCTQDEAIPVEWQRDFAARADEVIELEASHSPFLSQPEALTDLLAERAGA
jgi:pimeloyl-ACP methyl ester carboxylesterase